MVWQNVALNGAGIVGASVAIFHGLVVQRRMVRPLEAAASANGNFSGVILRLILPLLHFSTFVWLLGGLALVVAANGLPRDARLAVSVLVGVSYLFGIVFNFWATRGRHPGWVLLAIAVGLIVAVVYQPGS